MEELLKNSLPTEVIEVQEAIVPVEPQGLSVVQGVGIVAVVVVLAVLAKKVRCCKK